MQSDSTAIKSIYFARTDKQGLIQYVNEPFERVSQYSKEELIGNTFQKIRHPDMPKTIFRILWEDLSHQRPTTIYVKNKTKDGNFYWSLAIILPSSDGYLSLQIKPYTNNLNLIEKLYKDLLEVEESKNPSAVTNVLVSELKKLGHKSFSTLMLEVLHEELAQRTWTTRDQKLRQKNSQKGFDQKILELNRLTDEALICAQSTTSSMPIFTNLDSRFEATSRRINTTCQRVESLAINMAIAAHKLGSLGGTLSVIATAFTKSSRQILSQNIELNKNLNRTLEYIQFIRNNALCGRLIIEMFKDHLTELYEISPLLLSPLRPESHYKTKASDEVNYLLAFIKVYFEESARTMSTFSKHFEPMLKNTKLLYTQSRSLDLIRTGTNLETSKLGERSNSFQAFIEDIGKFIDEITSPSHELLLMLQQLSKTFSSFNTKNRNLESKLTEMSDLMAEINQTRDRELPSRKLEYGT